jgi:hypothetical protein
MPSQFAKPAVHVPTVHCPAAHPAVALGTEHKVPQRPQLRGSVPIATSQPSEGSASQLSKPALHAMRHAPDTQLAVPLVRSQTTRQPPQFEVSLSTFTSQPSATVPLQFAKFAPHDAIVQAPPVHAGVALGVLHARPQAPQFATALLVSTQAVPHIIRGAGEHVAVQSPAMQALPALQRLPQAPQFAASVDVVTSQPLEMLPSQSAKPALQVPRAHMPMVQAGVPLR